MDKFGSVIDRMDMKLGSKFLNSLRIKTQLLKRLQQQVNNQLVHDFLSQQNNRLFWRSPSHGAQPLGLSSSHQSSHQGVQARPAHPPPPKLARNLRLTNQAALRCQGEGRGRGWCCWAHPGTKVWKVENQGLARATQPTSRSETWQAGQANIFVGEYQFWWPGVQWAVLWKELTQCLVHKVPSFLTK